MKVCVWWWTTRHHELFGCFQMLFLMNNSPPAQSIFTCSLLEPGRPLFGYLPLRCWLLVFATNRLRTESCTDIMSCMLSWSCLHCSSRASMGNGSSIKTPTSSMQNKEAALIKVAGTTIHLHSDHSITGSVRCHRTRNLEVSLVYDRGTGIPMICSQTQIPSRKPDSLDSMMLRLCSSKSSI